MPAIITQQPTVNQLLSAYKPMVIECTAATSTGAIPTLVFCDVYINSVYYRTFFSSKADKNGKYIFDIQDAVQEKLNYFIPPIDGKKIEITTQTLVDVFVKIRTSKLNANGLNELEQIAPIAGTEETPPISGEGISSNKFFALNLLIQHEDNQDLKNLLKSYQTNQWNNEALPLTRRNKTSLLTNSQSSFFPFISVKRPKKICIDVKFKGQSDFTRYCKTLTNDDINEASWPPFVQIKWKSNNGVEDRLCNSSNCINDISISKYDADNDIIAQVVQKSIDNGASWTIFSSIIADEFSAISNSSYNHWYRVVVTDSNSNSATSNVLKITRQQEELPVFTFHYQAMNAIGHVPDDTVTYLDNYAVEQTTILQRTAIVSSNPCTLIVASSIVSTVGAQTCVPVVNPCMLYKITIPPYATVIYSYLDCEGFERTYTEINESGDFYEISLCAQKDHIESESGYVEIGPCS